MFGILGDYIIIAILFFVFLIFSLTEEKYTPTLKKLIVYISIIFISFFASQRTIGTDTNSYIDIYSRYIATTLNIDFINNLFQHSLEPGFSLMISYLKLYGFSYQTFFFLSALIPLIMIAKVIFDIEKKYVLLTFFLFLLMHILYGTLDVIRQFFAATIYFSALYSLSKNNKITYLIKTLSALLFHYSSLIFILITPLLKIRWSIARFLWSSVITVFLGFSLKNSIVDYIMLLNIDSTNRFLFKIQSYIDSAFDSTNFLDSLLMNLMLYLPKLFNFIIIILALLYFKDTMKKKFNSLLLKAQILGTLIFLFLFTVGAETMAIRIELLLGLGSFILLKEMLVNAKKEKMYKFLLILTYFLIYNLSIILYVVRLRTNLF